MKTSSKCNLTENYILAGACNEVRRQRHLPAELLKTRRVAEYILNKHREQPTRGGPPAWGLGVGLTTLHCKKPNLLRNVSKRL
jgi:hypothetical protein